MRSAAWILQLDRKTVDRRVDYFKNLAEMDLQKRIREGEKVENVYVDELITFEHTRCKPIAVFLAVSKQREILGFSVSSMPPIGKNLKKISLKKYGKRPNHREKGIHRCLEQIKPRLVKEPCFRSDQEPSYARIIPKHFPVSRHRAYPSRRAVIAGQGELKDRRFDPLFPINHTFAMLRAGLARLIRRTWSTTKLLRRLHDFLLIYTHAHNSLFIPQAS